MPRLHLLITGMLRNHLRNRVLPLLAHSYIPNRVLVWIQVTLTVKAHIRFFRLWLRLGLDRSTTTTSSRCSVSWHSIVYHVISYLEAWPLDVDLGALWWGVKRQRKLRDSRWKENVRGNALSLWILYIHIAFWSEKSTAWYKNATIT